MKLKGTIKFLIPSVLILGIWVYTKYHNQSIYDQIAENKHETIALVYQIKYGGKNKSALYKYRYNNEIYYSSEPLKGLYHKNKVNKYFVLHLSTENPELNKIFFNKEVRDETKISALKL